MMMMMVISLWVDSGCLLCQEDDDTALHFIAYFSALMLLRKSILGDYILSLNSLRNIHWFVLLKFAKASKRFYRLSYAWLRLSTSIKPTR